MVRTIFLSLLISVFTHGSAVAGGEDPQVVPSVDFSRYMGLWYEIAHNPNFFQRRCERSTARYELLADGAVDVLNSCYRDNRVASTIRGRAVVVDPRVPAKLKVDFGYFRRGDYWIVALDKDYKWAVVSGSGKSSLFILARQAPMKTRLLNKIVGDLNDRGFDTNELIYDKYD